MKYIITLLLALSILFPNHLNAEEIESKYQGEYSIDYLLRNYNAVEFNMNANNPMQYVEKIGLFRENLNLDIEGPILINGDYYNEEYSDSNLYYAQTNPNDVISFISGEKGEYVISPSKTAINEDFIDFNKLYNQILIESNALVDKTEYNINAKEIHVNKPGIYKINSTRMISSSDIFENDIISSTTPILTTDIISSRISTHTNYIYIDNYNPNDVYVFNNMKTYEFDNYIILLKSKEEETFSYLDEYIESEKYTGNIIFNYPNARFILMVAQSGKIIAPKADVHLADISYFNNDKKYDEYFKIDKITYHDSIFSNSITAHNTETYDFGANQKITMLPYISFVPYTSNKKIEFKNYEINELKEIEDFDDDIYTGTYSISEMLKNYNIVTLGQKAYGTNTHFHQNNSTDPGNARIFHIAGQFLINGELDSFRMDLESNDINESAVNNSSLYNSTFDYMEWQNNSNTDVYRFKSWGDGDALAGTNSTVYLKSNSSNSARFRAIKTPENYINYSRLYNKIVEEQKEIKRGTLIEDTDGLANIEIGRNYYIEDINNFDEIIFKNFEENDKKLTVITILNEGEVYLPLVSQTNEENYVSTKDYYGKEEPMFEYEYYNFPDDIYHGNIIWNIPNATYVRLADNAPFFGHIIAPNADLETAETHFSGSFIVNSLYAEGNSEAHFYPLQPVEVPKDFDCVTANANFKNGKWYTEESIIEIEAEENKVDNPKTSDGYILVGLLLLVIAIAVTCILYINRREKIYN